MTRTYKFYLKKNSTEYYTIRNGSLITTTEEVEIEDPINWRELELSYQRHERYHGVFRANAAKVQFPLTGKTILRTLYLTSGGIMAKCQLYVKYMNSTDLQYYSLYTSDIDFATYKSQPDYVEVSLMDSNLAALLQAYGDTVVDVPIDDANKVSVNFDGIPLKTRYDYLTGDGNTGNFTGTVTQGQQQDIIPFVFVRQIGDFAAGQGFTVVSAGPPTPYFFQANYTTSATIHYNFNLSYSNITGSGASDGHLKIMLEVWDSFPDTVGATRIVRTALWEDPNDLAPGFSRLLNINGTHTESLGAGWTFVLWLEVVRNTGTGSVIQIDYGIQNNFDFYITNETNSGEATISGQRWGKVFESVFKNITGNAYTLQSSYINNPSALEIQNYDAIPYRTIITSEQALKQIVDAPVIKTKFNDLCQDLLAGMGGGIGIKNEQLVVEKLAYFYDKTNVIYDIGDALAHDSFQHSVMEKYIVNTLVVGYDGYDAIDDINRVNEFNTKQNYTFPITRLLNKNDQEFNLVRPYYGSMYYIELVRAQNYKDEIAINNTKRDDANQTFIVYISTANTGGVYELDRGAVVSGIEFPGTAYNVKLSPKRTLLRNTPLLKSIVHGLPDKKLVFKTTDETKEMVANAGIGNIIEKADLDLATTGGAQLFQPVKFTFEAPVPFGIFSLLQNNPHGVIRFKYKGNTYDGFVLNVKLNPGNPNAFTYELLSSPNNDLSKLIG